MVREKEKNTLTFRPPSWVTECTVVPITIMGNTVTIMGNTD